MKPSDSDTIFAVATAPGRAGIAVMRVSGPAAATALRALTGRALPEPRRATLATLHGPGGERLDDALLLWFPAPRSYTGEDVAELHLHGGRAVVAGVTEALAAMAGLRPAEPGEFTRRAFDNGKLDLTAAEGLADLVAAETAAQRRQALRQMDGALAGLIEGWRERLLRAVAHLEAEIDFADEDLPEGLSGAVREELAALAAEVERHLADGRRGEIMRDGFSVAIVGAPNVGKSSLLNVLARREVAIVAETAGTTRDVVEVRLDLAGYPVILADTAGLREAAEPVEEEGIRRARARAAAADLVLVVLDATARPLVPAETAELIGPEALVVVNKCDLNKCDFDEARGLLPAGITPVRVSARTGEGLEALMGGIEARARARLEAGSEAPAVTRVRHRRALESCSEALRRAIAATQVDLAAEDARLALRALGRITGRVDVEELLDVIFRDFCIGK